MKKLLLKAVGAVLLVIILIGLVYLVVQMGGKLLGLIADPRLRVAELNAQAAHDAADTAYHEYMEVRAEADRLRQAVGLAEEQGENMIRRSVAQGYTMHTRAHTVLAMSLVGVTMLALAIAIVMSIVTWREKLPNK